MAYSTIAYPLHADVDFWTREQNYVAVIRDEEDYLVDVIYGCASEDSAWRESQVRIAALARAGSEQ